MIFSLLLSCLELFFCHVFLASVGRIPSLLIPGWKSSGPVKGYETSMGGVGDDETDKVERLVKNAAPLASPSTRQVVRRCLSVGRMDGPCCDGTRPSPGGKPVPGN